VATGDTATDASGRRFKLNVAQFYISGITLFKTDGSTVVLGNKYILKTMKEEEYYVDSVITGNYTKITFNVGIDATTNTTNPSGYPDSSPLSKQSPSMWFGTPSQGYIFLNIQGLADTTATQNGALNFPFNYRTGTSDMLRSCTVTEEFSVVANQPALVHFVVDYGKVLQGVDFKTAGTATPWVNTSVATQIANNIHGMISHEH